MTTFAKACGLISALLITLLASSLTAANYSVRIVDFGDDYTFHGGLPTYRTGVAGYGLKQVEPSSNVTFDVDGDGNTNDDSYAYHEFSTTVPLNVSEPFFNTDGNSAVFYGGLTSFFANQTTYWSEGGINIDHGRDDHNFHSYSRGAGTGVQAWGVWLWKKEDFLNKGDQYAVSFGADSQIGVYVSRYWEDWEEGRFVVKDNGQYYISEFSFGGSRSILYQLSPNDSRWAPYNPSEAQPYDPSSVAFDATTATFSNRTFTNIEEVGWYVAKPTLSEAQLWLKWYGFEVHAQVASPDEPSINIPMTRIVDAGVGNEGLYMADTEVSYAQWRKIYKWAARNAYAITRGFMFERDGDMGSMDDAIASHTPSEPVTDMTWADAALWCNALSIYEGLDPVYYADAALTIPLHEVIVRTDAATMHDNLPIYVDWSSNGFRLPTLKEWQAAAASASGAAASAWTSANASGKTQPVGTTTAASNGISDLIGNVWEYTWDSTADSYNPAAANVRTVVGGDYSVPANVSALTGPNTAKYSPRIGFRPVRYIGTATTPDKSNPFSTSLGYSQSSNIPVWRFNEDVPVTNPVAPGPGTTAPTMVTLPNGTFERSDDATVHVTGFSVSETEISFAKWVEVYKWAVANGYQFNRDGDMGSMDYRTGNTTHAPTEPVTDMAYEDVLLWCNALSEMEGRVPAYYQDEAKTIVFRTAYAFRLNESPERTTIWDYGILWDSSATMKIRYMKWDTNGYRLPTLAEWEYAARSGENTTLYPWGASFNGNYAWDADNSGLRTQPVGTKQALSNGLKDTSGNVFEWVWGGGTSYYYNHDPRGDGRPNVRGGSFRISGTGMASEYPLLSPSARTNDPFGYIKPGHAYPEFGFRIISTTADAHPADPPPYTPDVVLDIDPATQNLYSEQTYRGNMHRTGQFPDPGLDSAPSLKWSFTATNKVSTSPLVYNDIVYVGDESGMFYALDITDGGVIWSADTGESSIRSTPTIAHGNVYVIANTRIIAYDLVTGTEVFNVRGNFGGRHLNPAVIGNVVFWNEGWDSLVALDATTGEELWRHRDSVGVGKGTSSTVLANGKIYWCSGAQGFYGADIRTERRDWFYDAAVDNWVQTPAYYDGHLYTVGSNGIIAIDVSDGTLAWSNNTIDYESQAPKLSSPAVDAGSVYIGNGTPYTDPNTSLVTSQFAFHCFDRTDGTEQWFYLTDGANESSPAIAGNNIYFGSGDGKLYSLNKNTGALNWSYTVGSPINSSPVIEGNMVLFGADDGKVYVLESNPVSPPSGLNAVAADARTINLSWTDNTADETGYTLQRRTAAALSVDIIVDNTDTANTQVTGSWAASTTHPGFYGADYQHDGKIDFGNKAFRYNPPITEAGTYSVYTWYSAATSRASNVPITIGHTSGTSTVYVDQRNNGGQWVLLGNYELDSNSYAEITNTGTSDGYVCADAFRFTKGTAEGTWEEVATIAANATSYADTPLAKNTHYLYRIRANRSGAYSNWVTLGAAVATPDTTTVNYEDWRSGIVWSSGQDTAFEDPDKDGIINLLEFVTMRSPLAADETAIKSVSLETSPSPCLCLTFTRRKDIENIQVTVESSSDLVNWSTYKTFAANSNVSADTITTITSEDSSKQVIKVDHPITGSHVYMRLRVDLQ